jgi:hypothetical protein
LKRIAKKITKIPKSDKGNKEENGGDRHRERGAEI